MILRDLGTYVEELLLVKLILSTRTLLQRGIGLQAFCTVF